MKNISLVAHRGKKGTTLAVSCQTCGALLWTQASEKVTLWIDLAVIDNATDRHVCEGE